MAGARKLKVFVAQIGFHDTAVAVPSQAAALAAWGTHQNLFAGGQARVTDDAQAVAAATAHPGVPLRRLAGTGQPFELDPKGLPDIPDAPKARAAAKPPPPPPADKPKPVSRKKLDAAEAALREIADDRRREEADLQRRADDLEAERSAAQARYTVRHSDAKDAVAAAMAAYRDAGGSDQSSK